MVIVFQKASSRHSMVCEAKIKQNPLKIRIIKKKKIKRSSVCKNTNYLLEMQCCKRIGVKEKKSLCSGVKTHHVKTWLQPFLQTPVLQLNETFVLFFVISTEQTIGAINMFKNLLKLKFHYIAVICRWQSLVLFVVQTVKTPWIYFWENCEKRKKVVVVFLPDRSSSKCGLVFNFLNFKVTFKLSGL